MALFRRPTSQRSLPDPLAFRRGRGLRKGWAWSTPFPGDYCDIRIAGEGAWFEGSSDHPKPSLPAPSLPSPVVSSVELTPVAKNRCQSGVNDGLAGPQNVSANRPTPFPHFPSLPCTDRRPVPGHIRHRAVPRRVSRGAHRDPAPVSSKERGCRVEVLLTTAVLRSDRRIPTDPDGPSRRIGQACRPPDGSYQCLQ